MVTLQRAIPPFLDVNICALRGAGPGVGSESWFLYADWMVHPSCVHSQQADFHCENMLVLGYEGPEILVQGLTATRSTVDAAGNKVIPKADETAGKSE